jgi:hypothetical protein
MFSNLIEDTTVFKDILSRIKFEYDEYLFSLLRNQQKINRNHIEENDNLIQSKSRIEELDKEIKHIESLMTNYKKSNDDLEEKIKLEITNLKILKTNNESQQATLVQITSDVSSVKEEENLKNLINSTDTLETRTNLIKDNIIQNLEKINNANQKLKNEYVPYVVINNLNQSIKDVEVRSFYNSCAGI